MPDKAKAAADKKPPAAAGGVQRLPQITVGEMLRQARTAQDLSLEEVSAAIHIRVVQLRAIEEGRIETLPGMTYAIGFVRSYATFLKLDPADVVHRFKIEHGSATLAQTMHIPEPISDAYRPSFTVIMAATGVLLVLVAGWLFFSGGSVEDTTAEVIPPAPIVGTVTGITSVPVVQATEAVPAETQKSAELATESVKPEALPPALAVAKKEEPLTPPPVAEKSTPNVAPIEAQNPEVIDIKPPKGRVVLSAHASSWIEVSTAKGEKVIKKVLRPGDKYIVPDIKGLSLLTSNAGGLDILVDGKPVQSVGKPGEIVSGVDLDPSELKKVRVKVR